MGAQSTQAKVEKMSLNMSIDAVQKQQESASLLVLVGRSFLR
jgi:hypothetical protein